MARNGPGVVRDGRGMTCNEPGVVRDGFREGREGPASVNVDFEVRN
ncbi:MAG: hypothetical protein QM820_53335 [Minicystis sp.]